MVGSQSDQQTRHTGLHLLVDFYGAYRLDQIEAIRTACEDAARATGATILDSRFHHFGGTFGISGLVLLAESHLSIHTWPEFDVANVDIFVCGACDPLLALPVLNACLMPRATRCWLHQRGVLNQDIVGLL